MKENSLHHFDDIWHDVFETPRFILYCMESSYPILRLRRRNLFNQVLSQDVSNLLGQWHFPNNEVIKRITLWINCDEYLTRMNRFRREGDYIDSVISPYKKHRKVFYEDLFNKECNKLSTNFLSALSELIENEPDGCNELVFQKTIKNPSEIVENRKEVIEYFDKIPEFSDMVKESLAY